MADKESEFTPEVLAEMRETIRDMSGKERARLMTKAGFTRKLHAAMGKADFNFTEPPPGSDFEVLHQDLCETFRRRGLTPSDVTLGLVGAMLSDDNHFDWVMDQLTHPDPARFVASLSDFTNGILQVLCIFLLSDSRRGVVSHSALKRLMGGQV